jgi:hypothetical protein
MSARLSLQARIDSYIAERRQLGFQLHSLDTLLAGFARYVAGQHHRGPLTVELMANWARQDKWHRGTPGTWAGRLAKVRHFALPEAVRTGYRDTGRIHLWPGTGARGTAHLP